MNCKHWPFILAISIFLAACNYSVEDEESSQRSQSDSDQASQESSPNGTGPNEGDITGVESEDSDAGNNGGTEWDPTGELDELDPAKVSYGKSEYQNQCAGCHGQAGQGTPSGNALNNKASCKSCSTLETLIESISATMPLGNPKSCVDDCPDNIAQYIRDSWYQESSDTAEYILKSYEDTLREFSFNIINRVPTEEEFEKAKTEKGFEEVALSMMQERSFGQWIMLAYNDLLLTNSRRPKMIVGRFSGKAGEYLDSEVRGLANSNSDYAFSLIRQNFAQGSDNRCTNTRLRTRGLETQPLQLIRYIVENDLSTDLILTAPYTVINKYSLSYMPSLPYGTDEFNFRKARITKDSDFEHFPCKGIVENVGKRGEYFDPDHYLPAVIPYTAYKEEQDIYSHGRNRLFFQNNPEYPYPHAGILTTTTFLDRYQTNNTNRNRERASVVLKYFLDIDVGASQVDNFESEGYAKPVLEDPNCTGCHNILDPVASTFKNFQRRDHIYARPDLTFYSNHPKRPRYPNRSKIHPWRHVGGSMRGPGFAATFEQANQVSGWEMPEEYSNNALQWLAQQIVAQERMYGAAQIRTLYAALVGPYDNPEYFRTMYDEFKEDGVNTKNVKELVLAIIKHSDYRINGVVASGVNQSSIRSVRFLGPEMLNRKNKGILGFRWRLLDSIEARVMYGGIDSIRTNVRLENMGGVSETLSKAMASEMACNAVGDDFKNARKSRRFFPHVELHFIPETHSEQIRRNIVHMHSVLLNETLNPDDPEITATYNLFVAARNTIKEEGNTGLRPGHLGNPLKNQRGGIGCDGYIRPEVDPLRGLWSAQGGRLKDSHYTIKAWMAVMNYLLLDFNYVHD